MSTRIILIPAFSFLFSPSRLLFFLTFSKKGRSRESNFPLDSRGTRLDETFLVSFRLKGSTRSSDSWIPDASSLCSFVDYKGRGRERRCNYLFQRNLRDFCRGLLLVIGKMGLIMDDSERNVSYMSLSRACGFTLSKNFLLVYRIIILFRQFLYEATKLFSMRF